MSRHNEKMNFLGAPGTVDKSGLYPQSGYPSPGYPPAQTGMVQAIPQVPASASASAVAAAHRYPGAPAMSPAMSPAYAGMPLHASHPPSGYYTLQGFPTTTSSFSPYTPATQASLSAYPSGVSGLSSYPTGHPYQSAHPHHAQAMQYAAMQSMQTTGPSGYPSAAHYRTPSPSYIGGIGGPQLSSGLSAHPGNPVRLPGTSPLQHPGAGGYTGAPLTSVPRGYPSSAGGDIGGMPGLGTAPTAQHSSPFGGVQYPGY